MSRAVKACAAGVSEAVQGMHPFSYLDRSGWHHIPFISVERSVWVRFWRQDDKKGLEYSA